VSGGDNTTNDANSGQNLQPRGVGYSINGQRESGTEILLDGVENISVFAAAVGESVPIDSVQEYSVVTNNFGAEYGRASGGVVNVTTKSGSNNFHVQAWEFNRLAAYTSNTYGYDAQNAACLTAGTCTNATLPDPKGNYTRNQFGFEAGGPIIKNKLFAYASTEWTRVRSSASEINEVLDPAFIKMLPANVLSYLSQYGTGVLPASGVVTTAAQLTAAGVPVGPINGVTAVPGTTPVFDVVNFKAPFDAGGGVPVNQYTLLGRVDYNLSDKTQMFFRLGRENQTLFNGSVFYSAYPQYDVGDIIPQESYLYSLSHSFSPSLFTNSKFSFNRLNGYNSFNTALTATPNLMITNVASDPVRGNLIQLPGLENEESGAGGLPFGGPQNTVQLEQDLSWIKGRHNMKFGGQFTYIQLNIAFGAYAQASELLGNTFDSGMNALTNAGGIAGGSPLGTFAARVSPDGALPCPINQFGAYPSPPPAFCTVTPPLSPAAYGRSYRYKDWAMYAQDSFRATPRLTLNYGLRYEHYGVQHNNDQALDSNFYQGNSPFWPEAIREGQVFQTQKSPVGAFWAPDWGTAAPRVGFAYDVFGDGKTSLRGGFGISYERNFGNVTYNASFNPPASAVLQDICAPNASGIITSCPYLVTSSNIGPLGVPGPSTFLPNVELRHLNPHINTAQTQFWSLDMQRQVAKNTIVDIGYSGAHGVHLYDISASNLIGGGQAYLGDPLITGAACANTGFTDIGANLPACYTRPNDQYAGINTRGSKGDSAYHALNLKFQTQNLHATGLSLVANYTWSHSLDDESSTFSDSQQGASTAIGNLGYTDPLHPLLDWGSSDFDIRNRLVVSPVWELPWLKSERGALGHIAGGWTLSSIFTVRSGIPFSVFDYSYDENGLVVPRLVPSTPFPSMQTNSGTILAPNLFGVLSVPSPAPIGPFSSTLGISDFGPFPANMMRRNSLRGPGAWNDDLAISKKFNITERVGLEFRAEGFDVFNHHNLFVNTSNLAYFSDAPGATMANGYNTVTAEKGGLGTVATDGNHDERRFGQFALRVSF